MSTNLLLFSEQRNIVSKNRFLAQKYIDNGAHPDNFNPGTLKHEVSTEYIRQKSIYIEHLLKKFTQPQILRIKHHLNIRTKNAKQILDTIKKYDYKKIDKLYIFLLQVSKNETKNIIPKSLSRKISMKVGPKRKTRRKKHRKRLTIK
jgi:hypothetical protein